MVGAVGTVVSADRKRAKGLEQGLEQGKRERSAWARRTPLRNADLVPTGACFRAMRHPRRAAAAGENRDNTAAQTAVRKPETEDQ
ncbi:hypothetical protein FHS42_000321 [Streptomyces zagrosensis]|uniref:Uncharacterized protein n=1 Tax=Streptomyces zagrosensis TaxID=1042984 RepID=A0A7W9UW10_9ACTN|nr:hypothetical protein [Streptomyces zagrosensis]